MEVSPLLTDPVIQSLSKSYNKSPAQVLLKWALLKGYSILPKSTDLKHIRENVELEDFDIGAEDMAKIDNLERDKKYAWDPSTVL